MRPINKLQKHVNYLVVHPAVEIVRGLIQAMQQQQFSSVEELTFIEMGDHYFSVNLSHALYRRSVFESLVLFDEALR